jgi:hypothetical protein
MRAVKRRLPRLLRSQRFIGVVALLLLAVTAGQAFIGAAQIGISNDEPIHQVRMNNWLETGWYLPTEFFDPDGTISSEIETGRLHAYGAGFGSFGHVVAVLAGVEQWGATAHSEAAYTVRGLAVAALGLAAAVAVGYALRVVTGRWVVGAWAAAATFAMPLWTGYSMFAVKDVPAAAGWTFVTAALIVALHPQRVWPGASPHAPDEGEDTGALVHRRRPLADMLRGRPGAVALLCFLGVWFSFGTRTALWIPLAGTVLIFGVLAACSPVRAQLTSNIKAAGAGLAAGVVAVTALHYRNAGDPVAWLLSSVRTSGDFDWTGSTLTAGRLVSEKPPWWYLPAWLGGSVPLLLGLLALAGIALVIVRFVRPPMAASRGIRTALGQPGAVMVLWITQALALPVMAIAMSSTMYAGLRQHLYVLPALAALAGFAVNAITRRFRTGWPRTAALALVLVALAAPVLEQTRLFPYNFVYKNIAAGPVNDRWETDMHWISGREALSRVPAEETAWCYTQATVTIDGDVVRPAPAPCADFSKVDVFLPEQGSKVSPLDDDTLEPGLHPVDEQTGLVDDALPGPASVIARKYRGSPPAVGCKDYDNVTRPLRGEDVVISYVLKCDVAVLDR